MVFIFAIELFFVYWMLMWGVSSGGAGIKSWALNFALGVIQDIFAIAPLCIIIIYVIAMTSIKPQLRYIHRILHIIGMNYVQNNLLNNYEEIKVVQRFSPSCRAARMHISSNLAAGEILRALDDKDATDCQRCSDFGLSMVVLLFVMIPLTIGVLSETGGEIALDTAIPSLLSMFILANYMLYTISIYLLILPYALIIGSIVIKRYFYQPALRRVRSLRAEKERRYSMISRSDVQGWNTALRNMSIFTLLWTKSYSCIINSAAFSIYYMGFMRIINKQINKYYNEEEEELVQTQWRLMNLPLNMQGKEIILKNNNNNNKKEIKNSNNMKEIKNQNLIEKKKESRNFIQTLPRRIKDLIPGKDWKDKWELEIDEESDYFTDLMNRKFFHMQNTVEREKMENEIILKFTRLPAVFNSSIAVTQFRDVHSYCATADAVLLRVLYSYRRQMLDGKLYNLSLLDEQTLAAADTMQTLSAYTGLIHIHDLTMMLVDVLHYYHPYNLALSLPARKFIISQYNKWIKKNHIEMTAYAQDIFNPNIADFSASSDISENNFDHFNEHEIKGYYEPCIFGYRIIRDFNLKHQLLLNNTDNQEEHEKTEKEHVKISKHEKIFSMKFEEICLIVMNKERIHDNNEEKEFITTSNIIKTAITTDNIDINNMEHYYIADVGVQYNKFVEWFLEIDSKLRPRIVQEYREHVTKEEGKEDIK